jgi:tetratricopeptide (TPR) repeat protein
MRRLLLLLGLAACRAPALAPAPEPPPPVEAEPPMSPAMEEARWRAEMTEVLFTRHMAAARRYRDALDPEEALAHVDRALALKPMDGEARDLRLGLQRMVGVRAGEVETFLEDHWQAERAREEQREVEVRRALAEARAAEEAGDLERAVEAYERALFLAGRAGTRGSLETLRDEAAKIER